MFDDDNWLIEDIFDAIAIGEIFGKSPKPKNETEYDDDEKKKTEAEISKESSGSGCAMQFLGMIAAVIVFFLILIMLSPR
jgi:hypothetical protein